MSSVQGNLKAPERLAPARVSMPWGRWGLRATAVLYLGFMVALPLATIIRYGVRCSKAYAHHVGHHHAHQCRDGDAYRLRVGAIPLSW
jgi:hypothetical protein